MLRFWRGSLDSARRLTGSSAPASTDVCDGFRELPAEMQHLSERVARIETLIEIHHGPLPGP